MVWPILISVSEAPGSYFFWANADRFRASAVAAAPQASQRLINMMPPVRRDAVTVNGWIPATFRDRASRCASPSCLRSVAEGWAHHAPTLIVWKGAISSVAPREKPEAGAGSQMASACCPVRGFEPSRPPRYSRCCAADLQPKCTADFPHCTGRRKLSARTSRKRFVAHPTIRGTR